MQTICLSGCALAAAAAVLLATAVRADPLTEAMRREDPRLSRPVTIAENSIFTSELAERLGASAGVAIRTQTGDGSGDVRVAVALRELTLADAMDAVWSLVSYKGARWHWQRAGEAPSYRYVLTRPRAAQLFAEHARLRAQEALEQHSERMLDALDKSPDERRALSTVDRAAAMIDNSRYKRGGLTAFRQLFTRKQRQELLRGGPGKIVSIPLESAPAEVRRFAHDEWEYAFLSPLPGGQRRTEPPPPPPDSIVFHTSQSPGMLTPALQIQFDFGGYSYLGGGVFQKQLREEFYGLWLQHGDVRRTVAGDRIVRPQPQDVAEGDWKPPCASRFHQVSSGAGVSFLARLDFAGAVDPGAPHGRPVQEFLDRLAEMAPNYQAKWRRNVLLVTDPAWFQGIGAVDLPFELVAELRSTAARLGYLPLDKISAAVARLSDQQLIALGEEFPPLRTGAYWRGILTLHASSPGAARGLTSARGLPISRARAALAEAGEAGLLRTLADDRAAALRLREAGPAGERRIWLELLDRTGTRLWGREWDIVLTADRKPQD